MVESPASTSFKEMRAEFALRLKPENIQQMEKAELLAWQRAMHLGETWGEITIPKKYMPKGQYQRPSKHSINFFEQLLSKGCSAEHLELGCVVLTRVALLLTIVPRESSKGLILLATSQIISKLHDLSHASAIALSKPHKSSSVFERLTADDFSEHSGLSRPRVTALIAALDMVDQYRKRGLLSDGPSFPTTESSGGEQSRRGPARENTPRKKTAAFQPLPDKFVAETGWRLAWASKNLGPNIRELGGLITAIFKKIPFANVGMSDRMVKHWRTKEVEQLLRDFQWRSPDGVTIESLPFDLQIVGTGAHDSSVPCWPPRLWTHFIQAFKLVQSANMFIFFLSVGSRVSEALSLTPGCVEQQPDGISLADGLTYKISIRLGGERRDWALPLVAMEALKLQEELVEIATELGNASTDPIEFDSEVANALWLQIGSQGDPSNGGENAIFNRIVEALGLTELLDGGTVHTHRFRKTLARLAALAIVGAPKILMDLFGHKTIEMTLHYILSDPAIRAEIIEITKAQTIMFVEEALGDIDNCGGKAAKQIAPMVAAARGRQGREFGQQTLRGLAELLTLGGTQCQIVREGVLCMKNDLQSGPCSKGIGAPEPSRCSSDCDHRLERQIASFDADRCLAAAVEAYKAEQAMDNSIMVEYWIGQILSNLPRFDSVKRKWAAHPVVREVIDKFGQGAVT